MSRADAGLARRFREHLLQARHLSDGDGVVVALSGGLDSTVLLHLLRFTPELPRLTVTAAHLDHGMREGSAADADWVTGLARAWSVPLVRERVQAAPASEEGAREARYTFLEEVRRQVEAKWVLTAHHADDQVETVLFRIARGTGLRGLRGIPELRAPGVWRPLLAFGRDDLEAYGRGVGLRWREDPTNLGTRFARNAIRHGVLPVLERQVAPGVRDAVLRLARLARQDEDAWESLLPTVMTAVELEHGPRGVSVSRDALLGLHPALRGRLLRALARRAGGALDAKGTRVAADFAASGASGRGVILTGGVELRRALDRLVLDAGGPETPGDRPACLEGDSGSGVAVLGGTTFDVGWGAGPQDGTWSESFDRGVLHGPLTLRAWAPGDRIRLPYGTKKLKKLFLEARLPREQRARTPVLVDAGEVVLWIPGLVRSADARPAGSSDVLNVGVTHV